MRRALAFAAALGITLSGGVSMAGVVIEASGDNKQSMVDLPS